MHPASATERHEIESCERTRAAWPSRRVGTSLGRLGRLVALLAAVWVFLPGPAHAIEYEVFIDVDDEDDLYDLQATGEIDDSTFETLIELMRRGTDLETASREDLYALPNLSYEDVDRIIAYRQEAGKIADPADLVAAGVLSQRHLASIAAFIVVPRPAAKVAVDGSLRYRTMWLVGDRQAPPMFLQARLSTLRYLTIGAAGVLDRTRVRDVRWDPNREALIADPPGPQPRLPKAFAQWDTPNWGVIVGSYRIGFGQRLVFDNTSRYTPNGFVLDDAIRRQQMQSTTRCRESAGELDTSPCAGEAGDVRTTPDFYVNESLRGVAAGAKRLPVDTGWMQVYGFGSAARRPIYQYRIYDRDRCDDPRDDDPMCSAPNVYARADPRLNPTSRFSYVTLPNMYDEYTGGGNVSYFYNRRIHVGTTGYGSAVKWVPDGPNLDFQDYDRRPFGGPWGAIGADMAWGRKWADVFVEVARSVDSIEPDGGGGFAGIVRHTATWDVHEIEVVARVYDPNFANPYARAIAAPTVTDGTRNRDEAGGRIRYSAFVAKRASLRAFADVWSAISRREPALRVYGRADVDVNKWWRPGLWVEYQTRDLRRDAAICFEDFDEDDVIPQCAGQRVSIFGRSRFQPHKRVSVTLQYRHDFQDDNYEGGGFGTFSSDPASGEVIVGDVIVEDFGDLTLRDRLRQDINTYVMVTANPTDPLRLRTRWRWFWEDIADNARFENSVWGYFEASYKFRPWAIPALRYDFIVYIDGRDSTAERTPNPEHWLSFQWTSRF